MSPNDVSRKWYHDSRVVLRIRIPRARPARSHTRRNRSPPSQVSVASPLGSNMLGKGWADCSLCPPREGSPCEFNSPLPARAVGISPIALLKPRGDSVRRIQSHGTTDGTRMVGSTKSARSGRTAAQISTCGRRETVALPPQASAWTRTAHQASVRRRSSSKRRATAVGRANGCGSTSRFAPGVSGVPPTGRREACPPPPPPRAAISDPFPVVPHGPERSAVACRTPEASASRAGCRRCSRPGPRPRGARRRGERRAPRAARSRRSAVLVRTQGALGSWYVVSSSNPGFRGVGTPAPHRRPRQKENRSQRTRVYPPTCVAVAAEPSSTWCMFRDVAAPPGVRGEVSDYVVAG